MYSNRHDLEHSKHAMNIINYNFKVFSWNASQNNIDFFKLGGKLGKSSKSDHVVPLEARCIEHRGARQQQTLGGRGRFSVLASSFLADPVDFPPSFC